MGQFTQLGEVEVDAYAKVHRAATDSYEYYRIVDGQNIPITATEYAEATGEEAA